MKKIERRLELVYSYVSPKGLVYALTAAYCFVSLVTGNTVIG